MTCLFTFDMPMFFRPKAFELRKGIWRARLLDSFPNLIFSLKTVVAVSPGNWNDTIGNAPDWSHKFDRMFLLPNAEDGYPRSGAATSYYACSSQSSKRSQSSGFSICMAIWARVSRAPGFYWTSGERSWSDAVSWSCKPLGHRVLDDSDGRIK